MNTTQSLRAIISSCLILNAFFAYAQPISTESTSTSDPAYQLVWQDEFEENGKPTGDDPGQRRLGRTRRENHVGRS